MLYLERLPHPTLAPFIHSYWYSCDPTAIHSYERILPNGRPQIVLSLARDYLTNANHPTDPGLPQPAALFLGIYSQYQLIDTIDLTELIGITFHPGGTVPFFPHNCNIFTNCESSLEELWGRAAWNLRTDLRETSTPERKFNLLDLALRHRLSESRLPHRTQIVDYALKKIQRSPASTTVNGLARDIGISPRRLSQLFCDQIGVSPKTYSRIQRFQQAVQLIHRGVDIHWVELALNCGYYDQSHFANDFRAFSGISPTHYSIAQRRWANHIPLD
ncbi:MAG TPA: AraC family transcriptional regulator [Edaphobacter sp.]|jgi:AraC-like DNA-binding protein|nr:AraC family transcriptional regulator [Edaphobacter sp.]